MLRAPVITPLNSLLYNSNTANLAIHGLHPRYQHLVINLPQLLGPVYILLISSFIPQLRAPFFSLRDRKAISAISATIILSIFPHQEPRFLIPCVPLLLTCFRPPRSRVFLTSWALFNAVFGIFMGVYHQGGVVPTQLHMPALLANSTSPSTRFMRNGTATIFWWKTYPPPLWLLGDTGTADVPDFFFSEIQTHDLMGTSGSELLEKLGQAVPKCGRTGRAYQKRLANAVDKDSNTKISYDSPIILVAPKSATFLDQYITTSTANGLKDYKSSKQLLQLHEVWSYRRHLCLDDMDFGGDGVWSTLKRVVGRRGLGVWLVSRTCE